MLASTVAGLLVLRAAGRGGLARFRGTVAGTPDAPRNLQDGAGGVLTVLAGLLLFVPGFLTSLAGVLLLIGPVRQACNSRFKQWLRRRQPADPGTLDLEPGEWTQLPDRELSGRNQAAPRLTRAFLSARDRRVSHTADCTKRRHRSQESSS